MTTADRKSEQGFTLMELLVGINLAFIVLTLMVSVYLLTYKFIFTTLRKINEKQTLLNLMWNMERSIKTKESFICTTVSDGTVLFIWDGKDTAYITPQNINMSNYISSGPLDKVILRIKPKAEQQLTFFDEINNGQALKIVPQKNTYVRGELEYIQIMLRKHEKSYNFIFYQEISPERDFKNLVNTN